MDILVDFEFWTPPLGSLTCRSEWIRREPRANKLCTIVLLYVDVKICSGYLSGLDSRRVVMRGWVIVQGGQLCLFGGLWPQSFEGSGLWLPPETLSRTCGTGLDSLSDLAP